MNVIELVTKYLPILDEQYRQEAKSAILDTPPAFVQETRDAKKVKIAKMNVDGLADYSRSSGYVKGSVDFNFETVVCNFDRGRMFTVDVMDNIETMGMVFGKLSSEFVRTKVIPELDAFRMAKYASLANISTADAADLTTGAAVISALRVATTKMNNDEVPEANRILFIETGLKGLVDDLDTNKSKEVLKKFSQIIEMPQNRFYTAIKQLKGTTGEEAGGYTRAEGANNINFMVVEKSAAIQFAKRVNSKIITPEQNQDADAYKYGYRQVAIADAYENKRAGIYLHKSTVTA